MISQLAVSQSAIKDFACRGFVVFSDSAMALETLTALRLELERVLLGKSGGPYDSQTLPTKVRCSLCYCDTSTDASQAPGRPQVEALFQAAPSSQSAKTLQMINVHKASLLYHNLATSPDIGKAVCTLMGWSGARFCQDQVRCSAILALLLALSEWHLIRRKKCRCG